jgi:predicted secreted protein
MRTPDTHKSFLIGLICLIMAPTLSADETPIRYDQIDLSAQASMEVDNDTLIAVLYAQQEGSDLSALTNKVNSAITQAVGQAKAAESVTVQTLGYQTSPTYQQQRLTGWRVRQSIRLESRQSERLSQLLSQLQSTLALDSLSYAVSTERRQAVEDQLIKQAIDAFQRRAKLITTRLGHKQYRLVEMSINTSGQTPRPIRLRASMMAMEKSVAAPSLEAGSQTIRVDVSGRIELQLQ